MSEPGTPKFESHEYHADALILALQSGAQLDPHKKSLLLHLLQRLDSSQTFQKTENSMRSVPESALADMERYINSNEGRPNMTSNIIQNFKKTPEALAVANSALSERVLHLLHISSNAREIERSIEYFTQINDGYMTFQHEITGVSTMKKDELQQAMAGLCRRCLQDVFLKTAFGIRFVYTLLCHTRKTHNETYGSVDRRNFEILYDKIERAININGSPDDADYKKFKAGADEFLRKKYGV